jgi:hypothetical protein
MRICKKCNIEKDEKDFYSTYNYVRWTCRKCENRRMSAWNKNKSRTLKAKAVEYLGGKCVICGYSKSMYALDFAHQGEKLYEPSKMFENHFKWEIIQAELDKCLLKCANCHREETFEK